MLSFDIAFNYAKVILNYSGVSQECLYNCFVDLNGILGDSPLLVDFMTSSYVPLEKKRMIFFDFIGDVGECRKVFEFIFDNKRCEYIPLIVSSFVDLYRKKFKIGDLLILSSIEVDDENVGKISRFVMDKFKLNDVVARVKIDESIVAGFKLFINNKFLDLSIQGFLWRLESSLLLD